MQRLFFRIYGTVLFSIFAVLLLSYGALESANQYRYRMHTEQMLAGTAHLLSLGAARQQGEKQQQWLSLAASLLEVPIRIEQTDQSEQEQVIQAHDTSIIRTPLANSNTALVFEFDNLTEQIITGTAFLLLNEIGRHPVEKRQQVFNSMGQVFNFPISRLSRQSLPLDSQQLERLDRGETIIMWNKEFGRGLSVNAYAPWGRTNDVLALGAIDYFDPYPAHLIATFALVALLLIAISVLFSIKHLTSQLHQLQDKVDAISPNEDSESDTRHKPDAITELNDKIQDMAERIDKLLGEKAHMIRGISHDLRTPIAKIHFRLESLTATMGAQNPMLQGCRNDLKQLNLLIDELLTYEKLSVKQAIQLEPGNLVDLIDQQIAGFQIIFPTVSIHLDNQFGEYCMIAGNEILLNRLFENLLNNAGRYAQTQVQITLRADSAGVAVIIDDDGNGLEDAQIPHVFDPFFQGDESRSKNSEGYGLGLAIVKQVAMQHNGKIRAARNNWGGASFILQLPSLESFQASRETPS